jgi:hypothetical protein
MEKFTCKRKKRLSAGNYGEKLDVAALTIKPEK